jgi:hypothetical protein
MKYARVAQVCNPSTQKDETGGWRGWRAPRQSGLCSKILPHTTAAAPKQCIKHECLP